MIPAADAAVAAWARSGATRPARSTFALAAIAMLGLLAAIGFAWLGVWQVERRVWKLDLIARVDRRLAAPPVAVPGPADWPAVTRDRNEYRRVSLDGRYLDAARTFVAASTDLGPGFWLMTPLRDDRGFAVLVNRGFVPSRTTPVAALGRVRVIGLMRMTEPRGDLLRSNDPRGDRWYSRDVLAIAAARHLTGTVAVAPFFVDADAAPNPGGYPHGGLTVVSFPNSHLVYAITWFTLMAMIGVATVFVLRYEWRLRAGR